MEEDQKNIRVAVFVEGLMDSSWLHALAVSSGCWGLMPPLPLGSRSCTAADACLVVQAELHGWRRSG